jgi:hypothetical protein
VSRSGFSLAKRYFILERAYAKKKTWNEYEEIKETSFSLVFLEIDEKKWLAF